MFFPYLFSSGEQSCFLLFDKEKETLYFPSLPKGQPPLFLKLVVCCKVQGSRGWSMAGGAISLDPNRKIHDLNDASPSRCQSSK